MRMKMVKRYWCDHCNKAGLSASAMTRHEKHCTMNPARACRVCGLLGGPVAPDPDGLRALIAILPADEAPPYGDALDEYVKRTNDAIPKLREAANDCPACMLAALRQAKIHVGMVSGAFDFSAEMRSIFADIKDSEWPY